MQALLSVHNLTKIYASGNHKAVDNVSFEMYPGEILAIVGESGSGKTTVVNMITGLLNSSSGEIIFDGENITNLNHKKMRSIYKKMQMVFQSPTESFNPRYTLGDAISEVMINNGFSKEDALERTKLLLKQCGLPEEFADRYPHEVSGGQCQRAAIARALAIHPKLIILDESTSALDVTVQKEITDLLLELKEKVNISYLFICHDIALVQEFCSRVIVMYKGKIVEEGIPDEVIKNPSNEYTKQLINNVL